MNDALKRYFSRVPIIFPLISIFLIFIAIHNSLDWFGDKRIDIVYWLKPLVLILYAILWVGVSFLKRGFAIAFVICTIIHSVLFYFFKGNDSFYRIFDNIMTTPMPLNIGLSIIIIAYYRRFMPK